MSKLFFLKVWKPVTIATAGMAIAYGTRNWEKLGKKLHISNKSDDELKKIFDNIDMDHSGFIDMHELSGLLEKEGIKLSAVGLRSLMYAADENQDGKISFEEFLNICHKIQHQEGHDVVAKMSHAPAPKIVHAPTEKLIDTHAPPPTTGAAHVPLIKPLPNAPGQFGGKPKEN
jgi:hypothetical protein